MKVILKSPLKNIGKAGEVIHVKKGFARNYLFPKKLAIEANPKSIKHQEHLNEIISLRKKKALNEKQKALKEILNTPLIFHRLTSEKDRLFAAITIDDILRELKNKNLSLDKKDIVLKSPIKTLGEHKAHLKQGTKEEGTINITVLDQKKDSPS